MTNKDIKKIGIIGFGTMGIGLAQMAASSGYDVRVRDIKEEYLEKGMRRLERGVTKLVEKEKIAEKEAEDIIKRISLHTDWEDLSDVDFVIEAVAEKMEIKRKIFKKLDEICDDNVVLTTNTSGLSISEIASATKRPEKVAGMHFFNPVPRMKLVEVVKGAKTSEMTLQIIENLAEELGKETIMVEESPLFVVNRILVPMINEAIFLAEKEITEPENIDKAMKLGANHPIGPLALADFIGLDILLDIMETLFQETKDSKFRPCPLLKKKVRAGELGRKTGEGFYKY